MAWSRSNAWVFAVGAAKIRIVQASTCYICPRNGSGNKPRYPDSCRAVAAGINRRADSRFRNGCNGVGVCIVSGFTECKSVRPGAGKTNGRSNRCRWPAVNLIKHSSRRNSAGGNVEIDGNGPGMHRNFEFEASVGT